MTALWVVTEDNVALITCSQCAQVGMKLGAHVTRLKGES